MNTIVLLSLSSAVVSINFYKLIANFVVCARVITNFDSDI